MRGAIWLAVVLLSACGVSSPEASQTGKPADTSPASRAPAGSPGSRSTDHPSPVLPTPTPAASPTLPTPTPAASPEAADPRWRFFTDDRTRYASAWYDGRHQMMIGYGCTRAPYYSPDPRCRAGQGFHHGIDIAMPCGTPIRSAVNARVVSGGLGTAYGSKAFRLRTDDRDIVLGHLRTVSVRDGQQVSAGQLLGEAGALGAPDGCHLHLEVRRRGGSVSSATDPAALLGLRA